MSTSNFLLVGAAGLAAGAANAVAGGGTLLTFPALMAVGCGPLAANVTSAVGLCTGYAGGTVAYRRELAGQGGRMRALAGVGVVGAAAGACLVLVTPEKSFRALVPYLVLLSCALLAAQPALARKVAARQRGEGTEAGFVAQAGVLLSSVYGSYFGAGLGVLLLGVLGITVDDGLQRLNALKGVLSLLVNIVGVAVFLFSGQVVWAYAAVLAATAYAGGAAGVVVARRLAPGLLRGSVIAFGVTVAVALIVGS